MELSSPLTPCPRFYCLPSQPSSPHNFRFLSYPYFSEMSHDVPFRSWKLLFLLLLLLLYNCCSFSYFLFLELLLVGHCMSWIDPLFSLLISPIFSLFFNLFSFLGSFLNIISQHFFWIKFFCFHAFTSQELFLIFWMFPLPCCHRHFCFIFLQKD